MTTDVHDVMTSEQNHLPPGPPRVMVSEAVRRQWPAVLLPMLILLGVGIYLGLSRAPEYTAESRLTVGRLDVDPASLATFATATQSLASAYSRAVSAEPVVAPVAKRLDLTDDQVRAKTSASPIPESPVIRVLGKDGSSTRAIQLANATSDALVRYTTTLNRSDTDSRRVLAQYHAAALEVSRLKDRRDVLVKDQASKSKIAAVKADIDSASLRAQSLGTAYQSSQQGLGSSKLVGVLTRATSASNDRQSKLQLLALAGALAGFLIGAAVATLRINRLVRRSYSR
jgi:capsular polysaccharide biosynthesis protein